MCRLEEGLLRSPCYTSRAQPWKLFTVVWLAYARLDKEFAVHGERTPGWILRFAMGISLGSLNSSISATPQAAHMADLSVSAEENGWVCMAPDSRSYVLRHSAFCFPSFGYRTISEPPLWRLGNQVVHKSHFLSCCLFAWYSPPARLPFE